MEQELDAYLNTLEDAWDPWEADEYLCWLIESGMVPLGYEDAEERSANVRHDYSLPKQA